VAGAREDPLRVIGTDPGGAAGDGELPRPVAVLNTDADPGRRSGEV
jgi:hypothetical protein